MELTKYQQNKLKLAIELINTKIKWLQNEIYKCISNNEINKEFIDRLDILNESLQDTYNDLKDLQDIETYEEYDLNRDVIRRCI